MKMTSYEMNGQRMARWKAQVIAEAGGFCHDLALTIVRI
jgi:hypothetical protein